MHDGIRTEIRRTFIEGEGHLVEEVPVGSPLGQNQSVLAAAPREPAIPVALTVDNVPLDLARKVVEANGLMVVPPSFLNEAQLEELKINPQTVVDPDPPEDPAANGKKLSVEQAVKQVLAAQTFDELNRLTASDSRARVLAAAEERASELKEQGKQ